MAIERLHVWVSGRVQGVGFRFSIQREASMLGLAGWARNLPDGRVEAEFEGPRPALECMLEFCERGPSYSYVSHTDSLWTQGEPQYDRFTIR